VEKIDRKYRQRFAAGARIFTEGDAGERAYIIVEGRAELFTRVAGQRLTVARRGKGEVIGEMALVDGKPRTASAEALEPMEVLVIDRDYLEQRLAHTDPLVSAFIKVILERYRDMWYRQDGAVPFAPLEEAPAPSRHAYQEDLDLTTRRLESEHDLGRALDEGELDVFYQPIVELKGRRLAGCEALIRWHHPQRGLVPPIEFIGLAEETGLIVPIGLWLFERVCRDLKTFDEIRRASDPSSAPMYVSVNLSARQFEEPDLLSSFANLLTATGSDSRRFKLEITESLLLGNPESAERFLQGFKDLGFAIAIDDFGTGYSSFGYLRRYPIDTLKIDRSFVSTMLDNPKSAEIVHALSSMATELGMSVIAEGIEQEPEAERLQGLDCGYGQGYHFSKPLPSADFGRFLQQWKKL
jgi:EAL domain-containing protein (putative c-di-GMP-specific phosphodiesterase class I)